ncbi:hypothetical protein BgiBS90_001687 [Biomphalaria glabrata]|nr:hypothetical protein BgiBS90_001687 [Biomphalaria glabrata]
MSRTAISGIESREVTSPYGFVSRKNLELSSFVDVLKQAFVMVENGTERPYAMERTADLLRSGHTPQLTYSSADLFRSGPTPQLTYSAADLLISGPTPQRTYSSADLLRIGPTQQLTYFAADLLLS